MNLQQLFERQNDINQILDHYGIESQLNKVAEEAEELNLAYHDDLRYRNYDKYRENLLSELADVAIMSVQALQIVRDIQIKNKVDEYVLFKMIDFKINRTLGRIEDEIHEMGMPG